jgi:hypothetical protein
MGSVKQTWPTSSSTSAYSSSNNMSMSRSSPPPLPETVLLKVSTSTTSSASNTATNLVAAERTSRAYSSRASSDSDSCCDIDILLPSRPVLVNKKPIVSVPLENLALDPSTLPSPGTLGTTKDSCVNRMVAGQLKLSSSLSDGDGSSATQRHVPELC